MIPKLSSFTNGSVQKRGAVNPFWQDESASGNKGGESDNVSALHNAGKLKRSS